MENKAILRLISYCEDIARQLKSNKKDRALVLLNEFEKENKETLSSAREFKIKYLLSLHSHLGKLIGELRQNLGNAMYCVDKLKETIEILKKITDQRDVRDQIIKEVIAPIMKSWGYKKKERAFIKKEGKIIKKVNIYSSQNNEYYDVQFIFEISAKGPNIDLYGERPDNKWFELTEDTDLQRIKEDVKESLMRAVKPFLDKIK
ncbi:hypothetical protein JXB27_04510 [Candidatus Woesearchaeota archaeon]|nr:hypothetical protein [Candidatus Woesearchaeota archaeon]